MGKKKKLVIGAMVMSVAGALVGRSAVYQCLSCRLGTYSDGTLTSCATCPEGKVCPANTGTPFDPSRCRKMVVAEMNDSYNSNVPVWDWGAKSTSFRNLDPGIYQFEVASAGGGGAGSHGEGRGLKGCCSGPGGDGGAGDLQYSKILHFADAIQLTYKIGKGGSRGGARENGGNGGHSEITVGSYNLYVAGGDGGEKGGCSYYPANKAPAGNGLGGSKGIGGKRSDCDSNSARSAGGDGWIKIYKFYDCN